MPDSVRDSIYDAISAIRLVDPHTHINPHDPGSHSLADILGYHYYTELIHSAGMPQASIEEPEISSRELVRRLATGLPNIENTANYQWLIEICQTFFDFQDSVINAENWEALYDAAERKMNSADWPQTVLDISNVESVFLTNDFDDDLQGFDTNTYIPCLRTDDLVFHLGKKETRDRLEACSGVPMDGSLTNLRAALEQRFQHFVASGARACAISIPPSFQPSMVRDGRAAKALDHVMSRGPDADPAHADALSRRVFWTIAELCDQYGLPFDLMIGVNRRVYPKGVYQGQDLYDSRVSLIQYKELFNAFPDLKFPVSVLASVTNQELVSYSWIFPNVLTNGHWWYSNTPSFIRRDATARLEAVPQNKQIAYYSDAYKLEFVLPKFGMYRRILADILAEYFVRDCGWSEERAIELGRRVLRGNVDEIFRSPLEEESSGASPALPDDAGTSQSVSSSDSHDEADLGLALGVASAGVTVAADALDADTPAADAFGAVEVGQPPLDAEAVAGEVEKNPFESKGNLEETLDEITGSALGDVTGDSLDELNESAGTVSETIKDTVRIEDDDATRVDPSAATVVDSPEEFLGEDGDDDFDLPELDPDDTNEDLASFLEADADEGTDEEKADTDEGIETVDDLSNQTVGPDFATVLETGPEMETTLLDDPSGESGLLEIDDDQLDPLPSDDEISSAPVADAELRDSAPSVHDADSLEAEIDPMPLDVGNLDTVVELPGGTSGLDQSEIKMLRGETGFTPSDEDLILKTDPVTGELQFPVASDVETDDSASESATSTDSPEVDEDSSDENDEFGLGIL